VNSQVVHPSSTSLFFKEWWLVTNISILNLKLWDPAADSNWGGYSQYVERCKNSLDLSIFILCESDAAAVL